MSPTAARGLLVAASLLWSTGGTAIKLANLSAPAIAAGRAIVAAVVLLAIMPAARGRWTRPVLWTALAYAATCILFVFANRMTTAGNTIFLQNIAPVWVLLASPRVLGERPTRREALSVPISLLGGVLFFADDLGEGRLAGNLCAAASSVTYAILILRYRLLSSDEGLTATALGNLLIVLICVPLVLAGDAQVPSAADIGVLVYLGAVQQALAGYLFIRGIRGTSAMEGALLTLLEPLFSPLWAFFLVGEKLGPLALAGALLILGAAVWRVSRNPRV